MTKEVTTSCPYCGVGCGIIARIDDAGQLTTRGNPDHPANFGRLCSKGAALAESVGLEGRLLYPEIAGQQVSWEMALAEVATRFAEVIKEHGADAVAFYVSGQLLTEDYYVANKLIKGFLGTANIDTNSRLCMASSVAGHKRAFGEDIVPCSYNDLEQARLVVLTGSNSAWCHPVLYQRMVKAKRNDDAYRVVVIDPRRTATCDLADLHLPIRPGTDVALFNGLLVYLAQQGFANKLFIDNFTQGMEAALDSARQEFPDIAAVARVCGLSEASVDQFYRMFADNERTVSVYSQGVNQSSHGTDKVNAIINCHLLTGRIGRPGMGPFSFTGQPNAMGGREVGGLANQLAAHMDIENPAHRQLVGAFWQAPAMADKPGLKAVDLFQAIGTGKIRAVWIMATNPVVSLPDADQVRTALENCDFVVVSDCVRQTDTTACAHVLLPALAWGEKDGTVTNSERRITRQQAFLPVPGEAKPDWWIVTEVARRMGFGDAFYYEAPWQIFREHAALSAHENDGSRAFDLSALSTIDAATYENLQPVQWPVRADVDATRMFTDGRYFTAERKARFLPLSYQAPANASDETFPLILNTGRVRDQWHTMTRTGKVARLWAHSPEPYVEIHPLDASNFNLADNDLVKVFSRWGEVLVRCRMSDDICRGSVFIPMHWNDSWSSLARVDSVVNSVVDAVSGQPESKHTPVRLQKYQPAWHGSLYSRRKLELEGLSYWSMVPGQDFIRYAIAGEQTVSDWSAWARNLLCTEGEEVSWVEYLDQSSQRYRGVRISDGMLESCLYIAPPPALPAPNWIASMFAKASLEDSDRRDLLNGKPVNTVTKVGRIVCACFNVDEEKIRAAVASGQAQSVEDLGRLFQAGTNCGSCLPELKQFFKAVGDK